MSKKKITDEEKLEETEGDPVCERCGNIMIRETFGLASLDFPRDKRDREKVKSLDNTRDEKTNKWVCPHCQGEIDFLGDSPC